jgi:hypothetical protein
MGPSRKVVTLLFVLFGLVAATIGAYTGRSAGSGRAAAPAQFSPSPASAPAQTAAEAAPAGAAPAMGPTVTSAASQPRWSTGPRVTAESSPLTYLVAIRTGRHATYDRVVFQFRGRVPGYAIQYVPRVTQDASDRLVPLRGRAFLQVVFRHASGTLYSGPGAVTPGLESLLQITGAGDFEGYLSFGIGLADRAGFRVLSLADPSRVVIDVAHAPLPAFPGIWDIRTWAQAWEVQQAVDNGHQPWRTSPTQSVVPYAIDVLGVARPTVRLVDPHTVEVSKPGAGLVATVQVTQPVTQRPGGIWVITRVDPAQ